MIDPTLGAPSPVEWVLVVSAVIAALAVIYRYVIRPIARAIAIIAQIGGDWYGREGDPGHPRVPGVMERLASIESEVKFNGGSLRLADVVGRIEEKVEHLTHRADASAEHIEALQEGQSDARRAAEKAAKKAEQVDDRLTGWVTEGQVREQAYLASLAELGIDLQPQPPRDPSSRTRAHDTDD